MSITALRKCANCDFPLPPGRMQCPSCRSVAANFESGKVFDDEVVLLSEAQEEKVIRYSTGIDGVDRLFGGGIVSTSTSLVGGAPGAGKTTLQLQISDFILSKHPERSVMIIANEQRPEEIKTTAVRMRLRHMNRIRIVKAMGGLRSSPYEALRKYRPIITFVDSLNALVGDDLELAVTVAGQIKDLICEVDAGPAILISQVNKDFDLAGLQKLQHKVDATFILDVDEVTKVREFCSLKNRNGEAPLSIQMIMTETGLVEIEEDDEE